MKSQHLFQSHIIFIVSLIFFKFCSSQDEQMIFILKLGRQKKGVDGTLDGTTDNLRLRLTVSKQNHDILLLQQSVVPNLLKSKNQKHVMLGFFEFSTFRKQHLWFGQLQGTAEILGHNCIYHKHSSLLKFKHVTRFCWHLPCLQSQQRRKPETLLLHLQLSGTTLNGSKCQ